MTICCNFVTQYSVNTLPGNQTSSTNQLNYQIENSGLTPAYQVHVTISFVNNDDHDPAVPKTYTISNPTYSYIAPHELTNDHDPIPNSIPLNVYKIGSSDYLKIDIQYFDYSNEEHHHTYEGQFIVNETGGINPQLETFDDTES